MKNFNLSDWALKHQTLVLYFMLVLTLAGMLSYTKLGQSEDPPFTFKVMVVHTTWPGASAHEVELQITDKLEKKLQEVPYLDHLRSFSRPGESLIFVLAKDSTPTAEVPNIWYQVRKKIGDIRYTLPEGVESLTFNDEFGDVYGNLYALTGNGVNNAELKRQAEVIRAELLKVPDVAKVDFFGEQKQRIYIELSNAKLATLGVDIPTLISTIQKQNSVVSAGAYEGTQERIRIAITGRYDNLQLVREIRLRAHDQEFKLGDVAKVYYGFEDPPTQRVRYKGQDTLLIGISMVDGGDIIQLGKNLNQQLSKIRQALPIGLALSSVTEQPKIVASSVNDFVHSLAEALVIVLGVSLLSLGLRTGFVVAITIPVVLAVTFLVMNVSNYAC